MIHQGGGLVSAQASTEEKLEDGILRDGRSHIVESRHLWSSGIHSQTTHAGELEKRPKRPDKQISFIGNCLRAKMLPTCVGTDHIWKRANWVLPGLQHRC